LTFAQWQAAWPSGCGEDSGSIIGDPGFVNPTMPADDFAFSNFATSPAKTVGFLPFSLTAPGQVSPILPPPKPVLHSYQPQLWDLASFYY